MGGCGRGVVVLVREPLYRMDAISPALRDGVSFGRRAGARKRPLGRFSRVGSDALHCGSVVRAVRVSSSIDSRLVERGKHLRPICPQAAAQLRNDLRGRPYLHILLGTALASRGQAVDRAKKTAIALGGLMVADSQVSTRSYKPAAKHNGVYPHTVYWGAGATHSTEMNGVAGTVQPGRCRISAWHWPRRYAASY